MKQVNIGEFEKLDPNTLTAILREDVKYSGIHICRADKNINNVIPDQNEHVRMSNFNFSGAINLGNMQTEATRMLKIAVAQLKDGTLEMLSIDGIPKLCFELFVEPNLIGTQTLYLIWEEEDFAKMEEIFKNHFVNPPAIPKSWHH